MNYNEEILKKKAEIKELEKQQKDELIKSFPNIVGKIYKPSMSTLWKVQEVTYVIDPTSCLADVIDITVRNSHTQISTTYNTEIEIGDMDEVSEEIFNEHLNEAIRCLHLQCKK